MLRPGCVSGSPTTRCRPGYAGRRLEVRLGATMVPSMTAGRIVAEHARSLHKCSEDLMLDHYLEVLCRKPGALAGSTALAAARAAGVFTADHQRFWEAARRRLGDGPGTRALIGVLLLHRTLPGEAVIAGMDAAMELGSCDPDLVAVEARRAIQAAHRHRCRCLRRVRSGRVRPAGPSLAGYDQLLTGASRHDRGHLIHRWPRTALPTGR